MSLVTYIEHVHYAYDSCCIVARINLIISQMKRSGLRVLRLATWLDVLRLKAGTECWNHRLGAGSGNRKVITGAKFPLSMECKRGAGTIKD